MFLFAKIASQTNNVDPDIQSSLQKLVQWLERQNYHGWDPHDGLNSPLLRMIAGRSRILGLIALQLIKRSPLNLRPLLGIRKRENAKAMALLLEAYISLYKTTKDPAHLERAEYFAQWLANHALPGYAGACWGYGFPWANRHFYAPAHTPNVVTTAFVIHALLEFYHVTQCSQWLELAASASDFICSNLNRIGSSDSFSFSYTPLDRFCIHNANMLAASVLAQVAKETSDSFFGELAAKSMSYSLSRQQPDGSWFYGEEWYNRWIDSYHTGYSLLALKRFLSARNVNLGQDALRAGLDFYRKNFFCADGTVKYYHNSIYPLECHAFAHALITLHEFRNEIDGAEELSRRVLARCFDLFWDEKGFFHYRRNRYHTVKTPFLRWVEAWMFLALAKYFGQFNSGSI